MKVVLLFTALLCTGVLIAQNKKPVLKFGDITLKDFAVKNYSIDTGANAVILYNAGSAEFNSEMEVVYKYHRRVRILNKNAFSLATVEVPMFRGEHGGDKLENFRAATYFPEGNTLQQRKLDKESIFDDKVTKGFVLRKFTFPELKDDCIIEYSFDLISRVPALRSWRFQDAVPVLQSTYEVTVPEFLKFVFIKHGYYDLVPQIEEASRIYRINTGQAGGGTNAVTTHFTWNLQNLPAMKPESYTTTVQNYVSKIEFQLQSAEFPGGRTYPITQNWAQLAEKLWLDESFGKNINENNGFMQDDLRDLKGGSGKEETAKKIFCFVRDNFECTNHEALMLSDELRLVYKAKRGSVADLNMILLAMLRKAGIKAEPVFLSTREHGFAYDAYPILNKFNYLITVAEIDGKQYLLDASRKRNGFNRLPENCYNGNGHVINEEAVTLPLLADSLLDIKHTAIFISNTEDGKSLQGSFSSTLGYFESYKLRDNDDDEGKTYFKTLEATSGSDIKIKNTGLDSLKNYDENVTVHYDFSIEPDGDLLYVSPFMTEGYKKNPFTATNRNYPVEMPYMSDEFIVLNMEVPKGYKIDELPKSTKLNFNETECEFEYKVMSDAENIQVKSRLKINKTIFEPAEYESLRAFFENIVKKQGEQIVFKRK